MRPIVFLNGEGFLKNMFVISTVRDSLNPSLCWWIRSIFVTYCSEYQLQLSFKPQTSSSALPRCPLVFWSFWPLTPSNYLSRFRWSLTSPPACGAASSSPCVWRCCRWCSCAPARWAAPWLHPAAPPAAAAPPPAPPPSASAQQWGRLLLTGVWPAPGSPNRLEVGPIELGSHLKQTGSRKNQQVRWAGAPKRGGKEEGF